MHPVFSCDLQAGVDVATRAYLARQANDASYVEERGEAAQDWHIFPGGDNVTSILMLLDAVDDLGLDFSTLRAALERNASRPERQSTHTMHDRLETFADLCTGGHAVLEYTDEENLALTRLFAALHLRIWGALPVFTPRGIVGCDACIVHRREARQATMSHDLAVAVRDGDLDPGYVELPPRPEGSPWYERRIDDRPIMARLTWRLPDLDHPLLAQLDRALEDKLRAHGFDTAFDRTTRRLVAQKPTVGGMIYGASDWGSKWRNGQIDFCGAERVFTATRDIFDGIGAAVTA